MSLDEGDSLDESCADREFLEGSPFYLAMMKAQAEAQKPTRKAPKKSNKVTPQIWAMTSMNSFNKRRIVEEVDDTVPVGGQAAEEIVLDSMAPIQVKKRPKRRSSTTARSAKEAEASLDQLTHRLRGSSNLTRLDSHNRNAHANAETKSTALAPSASIPHPPTAPEAPSGSADVPAAPSSSLQFKPRQRVSSVRSSNPPPAPPVTTTVPSLTTTVVTRPPPPPAASRAPEPLQSSFDGEIAKEVDRFDAPSQAMSTLDMFDGQGGGFGALPLFGNVSSSNNMQTFSFRAPNPFVSRPGTRDGDHVRLSPKAPPLPAPPSAPARTPVPETRGNDKPAETPAKKDTAATTTTAAASSRTAPPTTRISIKALDIAFGVHRGHASSPKPQEGPKEEAAYPFQKASTEPQIPAHPNDEPQRVASANAVFLPKENPQSKSNTPIPSPPPAADPKPSAAAEPQKEEAAERKREPAGEPNAEAKPAVLPWRAPETTQAAKPAPPQGATDTPRSGQLFNPPAVVKAQRPSDEATPVPPLAAAPPPSISPAAPSAPTANTQKTVAPPPPSLPAVSPTAKPATISAQQSPSLQSADLSGRTVAGTQGGSDFVFLPTTSLSSQTSSAQTNNTNQRTQDSVSPSNGRALAVAVKCNNINAEHGGGGDDSNTSSPALSPAEGGPIYAAKERKGRGSFHLLFPVNDASPSSAPQLSSGDNAPSPLHHGKSADASSEASATASPRGLPNGRSPKTRDHSLNSSAVNPQDASNPKRNSSKVSPSEDFVPLRQQDSASSNERSRRTRNTSPQTTATVEAKLIQRAKRELPASEEGNSLTTSPAPKDGDLSGATPSTVSAPSPLKKGSAATPGASPADNGSGPISGAGSEGGTYSCLDEPLARVSPCPPPAEKRVPHAPPAPAQRATTVAPQRPEPEPQPPRQPLQAEKARQSQPASAEGEKEQRLQAAVSPAPPPPPVTSQPQPQQTTSKGQVSPPIPPAPPKLTVVPLTAHRTPPPPPTTTASSSPNRTTNAQEDHAKGTLTRPGVAPADRNRTGGSTASTTATTIPAVAPFNLWQARQSGQSAPTGAANHPGHVSSGQRNPSVQVHEYNMIAFPNSFVKPVAPAGGSAAPPAPPATSRRVPAPRRDDFRLRTDRIPPWHNRGGASAASTAHSNNPRHKTGRFLFPYPEPDTERILETTTDKLPVALTIPRDKSPDPPQPLPASDKNHLVNSNNSSITRWSTDGYETGAKYIRGSFASTVRPDDYGEWLANPLAPPKNPPGNAQHTTSPVPAVRKASEPGAVNGTVTSNGRNGSNANNANNVSNNSAEKDDDEVHETMSIYSIYTMMN